MIKKNIKALYKTTFALLALSSIALEIITLTARGQFSAVDFFSYFTILANSFAAIMLMISAYATMANKDSQLLNYFRGASTLFMVLTGVVFALLLSNLDPALLTALPWNNTVLHYIMPLVSLLDWVIDSPRSKVAFKTALTWLVAPLAYVIYSLARGLATGRYPYPFLNPDIGGYGPVLITCLCIFAFVVLAAWLIVRLQHIRTQRAE